METKVLSTTAADTAIKLRELVVGVLTEWAGATLADRGWATIESLDKRFAEGEAPAEALKAEARSLIRELAIRLDVGTNPLKPDGPRGSWSIDATAWDRVLRDLAGALWAVRRVYWSGDSVDDEQFVVRASTPTDAVRAVLSEVGGTQQIGDHWECGDGSGKVYRVDVTWAETFVSEE